MMSDFQSLMTDGGQFCPTGTMMSDFQSLVTIGRQK